MNIDIVHLPRELKKSHLHNRTLVVLDVLRATTTMVTALAAGAKEIRIFATLDEARAAAGDFEGAKVLCGESRCLRPEDFDLGNSPHEFIERKVRDRTLFLSTTNGTKAILAARGASEILVAGLVNASATAKYLRTRSRDVTFLCAGTDGKFAAEDVIGAGAVIVHLADAARSKMALRSVSAFRVVNRNLAIALRSAAGGQNLIAAGLEYDIDFAARVDSINLVAKVLDDPLRVISAA